MNRLIISSLLQFIEKDLRNVLSLGFKPHSGAVIQFRVTLACFFKCTQARNNTTEFTYKTLRYDIRRGKEIRWGLDSCVLSGMSHSANRNMIVYMLKELSVSYSNR